MVSQEDDGLAKKKDRPKAVYSFFMMIYMYIEHWIIYHVFFLCITHHQSMPKMQHFRLLLSVEFD